MATRRRKKENWRWSQQPRVSLSLALVDTHTWPLRLKAVRSFSRNHRFPLQQQQQQTCPYSLRIGDRSSSCLLPKLSFLVPKKNPKEEHQRLSFTISYLVDSCGLSPDHASVAARKLLLDSPERPNRVLNLLRDHGFSTSQISSLVKKRTVLLLANAESVLLPKLRFFLSIGVSKSLLARTLASDPTILTRSLVNQLIPSYNFLKSVLDADDKIVAALRRTTWIFLEDHTKNLVPNINHMSETGGGPWEMHTAAFSRSRDAEEPRVPGNHQAS